MHRCGGAPRLLGSRNAPAARSRQAPGEEAAKVRTPKHLRSPELWRLTWSIYGAKRAQPTGPRWGLPARSISRGGAHPPAAAIAIGVPHPSASDSSVGVPVGVVARITR